MDIENLVLRYEVNDLVGIVIKFKSDEATEEFYNRYNMKDICNCIEKAVNSKFGDTLKTFTVERTRTGNGFVYVKFKYSIDGRLTDSFEDYLCESVRDVVRSFGFKVKIQYLEEKDGKR